MQLKPSKSQGQISKKGHLAELTQKQKQQLPNILNHVVPKHLAVRRKKIFSVDKIQYKEPIAMVIEREKKKYMKPLSDVEVILKKFDEVSQTKKDVNETPRRNLKLQAKYETDLDKKIKGLLALPTVKNIKEKAEKEKIKKIITEPQSATLAILSEGARVSILKKYDQYIKQAVRPVYKKIKTEYH